MSQSFDSLFERADAEALEEIYETLRAAERRGEPIPAFAAESVDVSRLDIASLKEAALLGTPWDYVERVGDRASRLSALLLCAVLALLAPALLGLSYTGMLVWLQEPTVSRQLTFFVVVLTSLCTASLFGMLMVRLWRQHEYALSKVPAWAFGSRARTIGASLALFDAERLVEATLSALDRDVTLFSVDGKILAGGGRDDMLRRVRATMRDPVRCALERARRSDHLTIQDVNLVLFDACESRHACIVDPVRKTVIIELKEDRGVLKANVDVTGIGQSVMTLRALLRSESLQTESVR